MGWKGTVRSIGAAVRAAERDAQRRRRELEKQRKHVEKMQELARAAYEVEVFENYLQLLVTVHTEVKPEVDWQAIANSSPPIEPTRSSENEDAAQSALDRYKPGLADRMFGKEKAKKTLLVAGIQNGRKVDDDIFNKRLKHFKNKISEWEDNCDLARRMIIGDEKAWFDAIDKLNFFSDITELGSSLSFSAHASGIIDASIHIAGKDVIPSETKSLLKSGRLSVKAMPKGKFFELYQDHICSCLLRVASDLLSLLPINAVVVTIFDKLLNTKTGHMEEVPILSAYVPRRTLDNLNLLQIDPSDSMQNFVHNMAFKKTKGFYAVERIQPEQINDG